MKKSSAAVEKLEQIQKQMREMCSPHYDEFHKVTTEYGFTTITIPQTRKRAVATGK